MKLLQRTLWLVLAVSATAVATPTLTLEPKHFPLRRSIDTPTRSGLFRIDVPESVYRGAAHDDLRDLRVFNASGQAVPTSFRRTERETVLETRRRAG